MRYDALPRRSMAPRYRSYAPAEAPAPPVAPSPADAASPPTAPSPRYAYLVARLRNRQITMEEATELFQIQQRVIQGMLPPAGGSPTPPSAAPVRAPSGAAASLPLTDDTIAFGLVGVGAAAGLLAAVLQRSAEARAPGATRAVGPRA